MSSYFSGYVTGISPLCFRKMLSGLYAVFSHLYRRETCSGEMRGTISDYIMCNHPPLFIFRKCMEISGLCGRKKALVTSPPPACAAQYIAAILEISCVAWSGARASDLCFEKVEMD